MWTHWISGLLGVWTVIAAWTFMSAGTGRTLLMITGIAVAVLGFWGGAMASASQERKGLRR